jgi:hypothetical protein
MSQTIIHIDLDALDARLDGGKRWEKGWGDWKSDDGATCLHGAIRYCQSVPGDAAIIERVGKRFGFGINDNDNADSWNDIRFRVIPDITDDMLAETFGPQWRQIVDLVRRAAVMTLDEADTLYAAWDAAGDAAWDAAWDAAGDAAWGAARNAAWNAAWYAAWYAAWNAARDAAAVLSIRDLIGQHGFAQEHYDTLTAPWRRVIGSIHPDDEVLS